MNIYDIAAKADVSIATVSRVINNSGYVGKKTREKILAIIDEHNFKPSPLAQNLSTSTTFKIIGIICYNIEDMYYAKAVSVLEKKLKFFGYDIILSCTGESTRQKEKSVEILLSKNIDALIFVGSVYAGATEEIIKNAARYIPAFVINAKVQGQNIYSAYCDDKLAVMTATKQLLASHDKILYIYDTDNYGSNKKIEGFKLAAENGIVIKSAMDNCADEFEKLHLTEGIDAVICANDMLAANILKRINLLKIKGMPVIGHNNSAICNLTTPGLTSIDNKVGSLSEFTADNINKLFKSGKAKEEYKIEFDIVKRESF